MSSIRAHDTSADAIRKRYRAFFDNPFMPNIRSEQMSGADERVAYAAEFAAYQLGQIDEKLGRLIDLNTQASVTPCHKKEPGNG